MAACSVDATGNSDAIALTRLRLAVPTVPQHRVAGRVQRQARDASICRVSGVED
jgi:hypothetical protein